MFIFVSIFLLSFIAFIIHFSLSKQKRTFGRFVELFLLYQLVFNVGVMSLLGFIGQTFLPDVVANYLRWPQCPFQQELANANLGYAVVGFLCIFIRGHFWTAIIIADGIRLFADAIGHLFDALFNNNPSPGNTGPLVYTDFIIPILLVVLLFFYLRERKKKKKAKYQ